MKKILLTGHTGFVGRSILPYLQERYDVLYPTRHELNLLKPDDVEQYVQDHSVDVIFHSANPNPVKNQLDQYDRFFIDSLRVFTNIFRCKDFCEKIVYLGSGAEFDKRQDIKEITEDDFGRSIPEDEYGFSKYIMNEMAAGSSNVYNMRLFACFGSTDHESKFIAHAIHCCMKDEPITIRQDCWFDYLHIDDFAVMSGWFIDNIPKYHDYNISSGNRVTLSQIAEYIKTRFQSSQQVVILNEGMNKEYTADNKRLLTEMHFQPMSVFSGIDRQIEWQRRNDS